MTVEDRQARIRARAEDAQAARSAGMFEVAASRRRYGRAIEANNSTLDVQLKEAKLTLDQRRLELKDRRAAQEIHGQAPSAIATVLVEDRNELIRSMHKEMKGKP